jgi:GNAT superfamily N-acetyltransferase
VAHGPELTPRQLWLMARLLGGEPELEWTFVLFAFRSLALEVETGPESPHGLDLYYDSLRSWQELVDVLTINRTLTNGGVPPQWVYAITVGMEMFESGYRAPRGRLPWPDVHDTYRGRHSVVALDVTERDELVFANSWGTKWGDAGYGYISRAYFEAHVDSVFVTRPAWVGPSPQMDEALRHRSWVEGRGGTPSPQDVIKTWTTPGRRSVKTIHFRGQEYQVTMRRTFSARSESPPFDMIDLRDTEGRILGRTHVVHQRDLDSSTIEELFVAPEFRRLGYGKVLVGLATERVVGWRKRKVELLLHEADASPSGQARAIAFGSACGFTWDGRSSRRPNIIDTAYRRLENDARNT